MHLHRAMGILDVHPERPEDVEFGNGLLVTLHVGTAAPGIDAQHAAVGMPAQLLEEYLRAAIAEPAPDFGHATTRLCRVMDDDRQRNAVERRESDPFSRIERLVHVTRPSADACCESFTILVERRYAVK